MKTYEETIRTVLDRAERMERQRKKRRAAYRAAAGWGCCACLMLALGVGVWPGGMPGKPELPGPESGVSDPAEDKIVVCSLEDNTARSKMDIALMMDDFVEMTPEELTAYYGMDVVPQVPADLKAWEDQIFGIFRRGGGMGEVYWDGNVLNFSDASFARSVNLEVWKDRGSITTCYAFFDFIEEYSVINGVEVALAVSEGGYYHAEFSRGGVGFRLIAEGLSREEVVDVVRSLTE